MKILRTGLAYALAVIAMAVSGTAVQTQFVLGALSDVGADIPLDERVSMTLFDIQGFAPTYAGFIAVGFAIAFFAGWLVIRFAGLPRRLVQAVAGAACMAVMLVLMEQVFFGVPVIAGARTGAGFAAQVGLGALWGLVFAALARAGR